MMATDFSVWTGSPYDFSITGITSNQLIYFADNSSNVLLQ